MNILLVKTSAIGDVVHTLPALTAIRKKYPEARIDWLVEEAASEVVLGHKAIDNVLVSKRRQWMADWQAGRRGLAIKGVKEFVKKLRSVRYDLLIDFQSLLKSGIFIFLARAKRKVGFGRGMEHAECSWLFLNERIPAISMDEHALLRELHLVQAIGIDADRIEYDFPVGEVQRDTVRALLYEQGVDHKKKLVAINPMTTWQTKHWYDEHFVEVARQILADGCNVVFTGGLQDQEAIGDICKEVGVAVGNLAGLTSLKELAAFYQLADVLVTTDTGPMHISAAVDTPVVALFGPTAPWRTGPFGDQHTVLQVKMECSPCLKRSCDGKECMSRISVKEVVDATRKILTEAA